MEKLFVDHPKKLERVNCIAASAINWWNISFIFLDIKLLVGRNLNRKVIFFSTYTEAAVQVLTRKALLTTNWPEYQDTLTYFEIYLILVFG